MPDLRFAAPEDDAGLADWQHVHNVIIPTHTLSLPDVRERAGRNHLELACLGDELIGCSTVRPPSDGTATVIARILKPHRGHGYGTRLYERALTHARALNATTIETVVLSSNTAGLRFALHHGFQETDRYLLPGDTIPWIDLRLADQGERLAVRGHTAPRSERGVHDCC